MDGKWFLPRCQCLLEVVTETAGVHGFCQQHSTGLTHSVAGCGVDVQARVGAGRLHSESAPLIWVLVVVVNTIFPGQEHFFSSVHPLDDPNHEIPRLT